MMNDWEPSMEEIQISQKRIDEKLKEKLKP
jgi:hypothetical protein